MKIKYTYLRVWFDYRSTGLFTERDYPVKRDTLELPQKIWDSIDVLLEKYSTITLSDSTPSYGKAEKLRRLDTIRELDIAGIEVAREIKSFLGDEIVVEYFSEGLIQNVPFTEYSSSLDYCILKAKEDINSAP